jgi:hypothetical protein
VGLVTNGLNYRFFYLDSSACAKGDRAVQASGQSVQQTTYQYMPSLNLIDIESAVTLRQVLKAILDWKPV